jgi:hypothetical protein
VYAGGSFTTIGGLPRARLAKLSAQGTGAADSTWLADCDAQVNSVIAGERALYVGGEFTQAAGQSRAGVMALTYLAPQLLGPQFASPGPFRLTLTGERGQRFEILASTNLLNWDSLATLTNSTGSTNFSDSNSGLPRRFYRAHQLP